jgi:hypothetical protein
LRSAALFVIAVSAITLSAQSLTIDVAGNSLRVKAPGFGIVQGQTLQRLKDGRSVRVELELTVLTGPSGRELAQTRQIFGLSFDLWDERFVVTRAGTPPRSMSFTKASDTDAWCVENVAVPIASFSRRDRTAQFWVRLAYRAQDPSASADSDPEPGFTLTGLIDKLSRKSQDSDVGASVEAGPFRLN